MAKNDDQFFVKIQEGNHFTLEKTFITASCSVTGLNWQMQARIGQKWPKKAKNGQKWPKYPFRGYFLLFT